ncbi:MAG: SIR2 family protein [Verrucomicrobia bacterium]|nr:SIR2 family protein [Verrucomicrobiota bacterium]
MSEIFRKISAEEFSRRIRMMSEHPDSRFAFFVGSGCSVSSGIPAAGTLVKNEWLPRLASLRAPRVKKVDTWAKDAIPGYDPENPAASYGRVMEELFLLPEERQREIERLCWDKFPGFGYAVLANLMARGDGRFNVALTANFDDLIADALYLFTKVRPLVTQHESLANYIRPTRTRPLIVKLHGDNVLSPLNTSKDVGEISTDVEKRVRGVIRDRGLIFMGYGGNDERIVRILEGLTEEALPLGVYWVSKDEPSGAIRPWLESRETIWVPYEDFDETMLLFRDVFDLAHPDSRRFDNVFKRYTKTYQNLSKKVQSKPETSDVSAALKEAVTRTDETLPDWWSIEVEADKIKAADATKADAIYVKGLEKYPDSPELLLSYANFLRDFRKDNIRAEEFYQKTLKLDAGNTDVLLNYAFFLAKVRKDLDKAEDMYERALKIDPEHARMVGTFASFLAKVRKDAKRAQEYYQRAISIDPSDPYIQVSYAGFLLAQGRDKEGITILNKVLPGVSDEETPHLALESWFYLLVSGPEDTRNGLVSDMKKVLESGHRRPGLMLSPNIARARQTSHPDVVWLEKLSAVINDEAKVEILQDWPAWKKA